MDNNTNHSKRTMGCFLWFTVVPQRNMTEKERLPYHVFDKAVFYILCVWPHRILRATLHAEVTLHYLKCQNGQSNIFLYRVTFKSSKKWQIMKKTGQTNICLITREHWGRYLRKTFRALSMRVGGLPIWKSKCLEQYLLSVRL